MENTLDNIIIQYDHMNGNFSSCVKTTLKEFLQLDPHLIHPKEKRLQKALKKLYKLNSKNPPLFKGFPDRGPDNPLTIRATTLKKTVWSSVVAAYASSGNWIEFDFDFSLIGLKGLLLTLAHELKHAEHCSTELLQASDKYEKTDHLAYQQLRLLDECVAYNFEDELASRISLSGKLFRFCSTISRSIFGLDKFSRQLWGMFNVLFCYQPNLNEEWPILKKDVGLTQIPDSFNIPKKYHKSILRNLQKIPRRIKGKKGLFQRLLDDNLSIPKDVKTFFLLPEDQADDIFYSVRRYAIDTGDVKAFKRFLTLYDASGNETEDMETHFRSLFSKYNTDKKEDVEMLARCWLEYEGKSAVKPEWIKIKGSLMNADFLTQVLENYKKDHPEHPIFKENPPSNTFLDNKDVDNIYTDTKKIGEKIDQIIQKHPELQQFSNKKQTNQKIEILLDHVDSLTKDQLTSFQEILLSYREISQNKKGAIDKIKENTQKLSWVPFWEKIPFMKSERVSLLQEQNKMLSFILQQTDGANFEHKMIKFINTSQNNNTSSLDNTQGKEHFLCSSHQKRRERSFTEKTI